MALDALGEILPAADEPAASRRAISLSAPDLPALLAAWLEELVYLAETTGFRPDRIGRLELEDGRLEATVIGRRAAPQTLIKAVTYHRLEFGERADGRWSARVVFDV